MSYHSSLYIHIIILCLNQADRADQDESPMEILSSFLNFYIKLFFNRKVIMIAKFSEAKRTTCLKWIMLRYSYVCCFIHITFKWCFPLKDKGYTISKLIKIMVSLWNTNLFLCKFCLWELTYENIWLCFFLLGYYARPPQKNF